MSVDITVYLGPYFECKTQSGTQYKKKYGCPNPNCIRCGKSISDTKEIYCSRCGGNLCWMEVSLPASFPNEEEVSQTLHGQFDEVSWKVGCKGAHIWIENSEEYEGGGKYFDPYDGGFWCEINLEQMVRETVRLCEKNKDVLETLRRFYGEDNVKARWGLLNMVD